MKNIRVMIIDDSALIRHLTSELLSQEPGIELVAMAQDALAASEKLKAANPDVILLDVEMPRMNGFEFLRQIRNNHPARVVMFSSTTQAGCDNTFKALELGAVDFMPKPKLDVERGFKDIAAQLVHKVRAAAESRHIVRRGDAEAAANVRPVAAASTKKLHGIDLFAIGSSTGGTEALRRIFSQLPSGIPPIVIVQHMPEHFTKAFAKRLDSVGNVRVKEAENGDRLAEGCAYLAPGSQHMEIQRLNSGIYRIRLTDGPQVNGHRPSVDVLFHSCAKAAGKRAFGVILTGMGNDGAKGLLAMRTAGSHTIAQNESTSVVFGMPREAIALGAAERIMPLDEIPLGMAA